MNSTATRYKSDPDQNKEFSIAKFLGNVFWLALFGLLIIKLLFFQQVTVVGQSMEPNYFDGELLLVNNVNRDFQRGQVVAVYEDREVARDANYFTRYSARFFLKRIIALPGEEVEIIGSKVIIFNDEYPDGVLLNEDYITPDVAASEESRDTYFPRTEIKSNEFFVLGDNRSNSTDSRERGTFPEYSIFGQESFRFWPAGEFSWFDLPDYQYQRLTPDIYTRRAELQDMRYRQLGGFFEN